MCIPLVSLPPGTRSTYILGQLEGEAIEILGGHAVIRVLVSDGESDGRLAVCHASATRSDVCSVSPQPEAYNAILVTKGYIRVSVGDKCREMYPGDFVYVPPGTPYSYQPLAPYSEFLSVASPGNLLDFFRAVGKEFTGLLIPDNTGDGSLKTPTTDSPIFRLNPNAAPLESSGWLDTDNVVPGSQVPYFLRANTGPCWAFGGVISRPLIRATGCDGKFSVSVMESSSAYHIRPFFDRYISFTNIDHCIFLVEGEIKLKSKGDTEWALLKNGQTIFISARQFFTVDIISKFVRLIMFTNGTGMDELIHRAGYECRPSVLPNSFGNWDGWDETRLKSACAEVGAQIE